MVKITNILFLYCKRMYEKENQCQFKTPKHSGSNSKTKKLESGNDYVLKRYRLEENRHFKDRKNDELRYENPLQKKSSKREQQQIQQDLIIVPLEPPSHPQYSEELEENKQQKKVNLSDMVYVFDDDEENSSQAKKQENSIIDEKEEILLKRKIPNYNDITLKGSERSAMSTAELISPKEKNTSLFNPLVLGDQMAQMQRKAFQRKQTVNYNKKQPSSLGGIDQLKGVEVQQTMKQNGVSITIVDKKVFSMCKLPSGIVLRCIIKRTSSFLNMLSPQFDLYLANGLKHIVSAKKYPMRNRQLFKFSTDPVNFTDSGVLAVMHANTNHNIYWLLDQPKNINGLEISLLHLIVGYYRLKKDGQRKFSTLLPQTKEEFHLAIDYEQSFINFANFKQEINIQLNSLQEWQGQSKNSTKNCVLADEDEPDYRYLQMSKKSDNMFELIIQHPLSPLQAMAIAMTRFDAQLN